MSRLAAVSEAIVIVDVLSFTTAVEIALANGAVVYPYARRDDAVDAYARSLGALLAAPWRTKAEGGYSLSPSSLVSIPAGTRLVLPSPNGSTLSLAAGGVPTFAGCLRNAKAVAQAAQMLGKRIGVIPAGERWPDGTLRPAIEDLIGAGAIINTLEGTRSPEAQVAESAFLQFKSALLSTLMHSGSGKELTAQGFTSDVHLAAQLNVSACVPLLTEGAYVRQ